MTVWTDFGRRREWTIGWLTGRRLVAGLVVVGLAVVVGANHPWAKAYGIDSAGFVGGQLVGGVVAVGLGNQACVGVEVGGPNPGFFGSLTDASACDY